MKEDIEAAREELKQYQIAKKYIQHLKEKIANLRSRINSTTFQVREIDIQYNVDPSAKEELLAALVDLQILYGQKQVEAERLCYDLEVKIGKVDGVPGLILSKKYIQGKSFEKIAAELSYSYRQIKRLHWQGLFNFKNRNEVLQKMLFLHKLIV